MPEDQPTNQPSNAFSYDPAKFEKLVENMLGSHRNYRDDSAVTLSRMTDMNKEISSLNEKLMLLSLGTIGLSVSALISFVSKFALTGIHKIVVVTLASVAWGMLLFSAICFRRVTNECMMANKKLLFEWISAMTAAHGSAIIFHSQRVGTAFTGTTMHEGAPYDPKEEFSKLADQTKALFESAETQHFKKVLAQIKLQPELTSKMSNAANNLFQISLLLLAITAIVLFAGM